VRGCELTAKVFKFRAASDNPARQRMANKFYIQCSAHGTIGGRGDAAVQEFIMENGDIWGAEHKAEKVEAEPAAAAPAVVTPKPAPKPAPELRPSRSDMDQFMWGEK